MAQNKEAQNTVIIGHDEALRPIDENVIRVLVENHRRFRAYLAKRVGSESVAEDLIQSAIRTALEKPAESQDERSITAWFFRVLKNRLTDYYRSQAAEERKHEGLLQSLAAEGRTQERAADDLEAAICECMTGLLPTLNANYAELIRRIDLGGESIQSVASDLNLTENNLNVRLHRARQALKISLERTCGTCTEHGCLNCTCE